MIHTFLNGHNNSLIVDRSLVALQSWSMTHDLILGYYPRWLSIDIDEIHFLLYSPSWMMNFLIVFSIRWETVWYRWIIEIGKPFIDGYRYPWLLIKDPNKIQISHKPSKRNPNFTGDERSEILMFTYRLMTLILIFICSCLGLGSDIPDLSIFLKYQKGRGYRYYRYFLSALSIVSIEKKYDRK